MTAQFRPKRKQTSESELGNVKIASEGLQTMMVLNANFSKNGPDCSTILCYSKLGGGETKKCTRFSLLELGVLANDPEGIAAKHGCP